ncbi:MAG: phage integrase SAM-like domain-containing protein, partial [Clostridia bacterium]|nr:phage integrase SAM-like domain-containing protein [Clostridia bacterium]
MKERILTTQLIKKFTEYLKSEEKSNNTISKYIRD